MCGRTSWSPNRGQQEGFPVPRRHPPERAGAGRGDRGMRRVPFARPCQRSFHRAVPSDVASDCDRSRPRSDLALSRPIATASSGGCGGWVGLRAHPPDDSFCGTEGAPGVLRAMEGADTAGGCGSRRGKTERCLFEKIPILISAEGSTAGGRLFSPDATVSRRLFRARFSEFGSPLSRDRVGWGGSTPADPCVNSRIRSGAGRPRPAPAGGSGGADAARGGVPLAPPGRRLARREGRSVPPTVHDVGCIPYSYDSASRRAPRCAGRALRFLVPPEPRVP